MKLSKHSRDRLKQRANIKNQKIQENFFRNALQKGISPEQIEDEQLRSRLKSREKYNSKVKYYKGWVFVYSKNSHRLYTTYKLEEL
jgi:hypothetical protein